MKSYFLIFPLLFISFFLITSTISANRNNLTTPLIEKKKQLSQSLDSLDLIKQNNKRYGKSITEIELKQEKIIDSLTFIKKKIQSDHSSENKLLNAQNKIPLFFKPLTTSDWLFIVSGIIVLFLGILLLFRLLKRILFREHKNNKIISLKNKSITHDKSLLKDTSDTIDSNIGLLEKLQTIPYSPPSHTTNNKPEMPLAKEETLNILPGFKPSLENNIIKAASDGMDIQEISRTFHLSSDHVALIIKMSHNKSTDK